MIRLASELQLCDSVPSRLFISLMEGAKAVMKPAAKPGPPGGTKAAAAAAATATT